MQDRPTFGVLSNQGLCHLSSVATTTENFSESKFRKKKSKFFVYGKTHYHTIFIYGKMLIIEFSYNFLYVWHCMKLYDKKFWSTRVTSKRILLTSKFTTLSPKSQLRNCFHQIFCPIIRSRLFEKRSTIMKNAN